MGRGDSDILFGSPILIKKERSASFLFQEKAFPALPRQLVPTSQGFFLLDDNDQIHSLDRQGQEISTFQPFRAYQAVNGLGKISLVPYAAAWLDKDGTLFYKNTYPDLALDSQAVPYDELAGEDVLGLQVTQGNGLFLVTEGQDEKGRTRSRVWETRIDPTMPISRHGWKSVLPESQGVHAIKTSPEGMWIFSIHEEGERRPQIDWLPIEGERKTWDFLDWGYGDFFASQSFYFWRDHLLYKKDNTVIAVDLNDRHGQKEIFYKASGQIFDFALAGDTLLVREEKTLSSLDLLDNKKYLSVDIDVPEAQLLTTGNDLLLWSVSQEKYLRLPDFLKR